MIYHAVPTSQPQAMISSIFLTNRHGKLLLFRAYGGKSAHYDACAFGSNMIKHQMKRYVPIQQFGLATYFNVHLGECYITASCYGNANAVLVLQCLSDLRSWICKLLGSQYDEAALLANANLIYEMLDHAVDAGYPQDFYIHHLDYMVHGDILNDALGPLHPGMSNYLVDYGVDCANLLKGEMIASYVKAKVTPTPDPGIDYLKLKVPWRLSNSISRKNTITISLTECIQCSYSQDGDITSNEIKGAITMDCQLKGMPTVLIGMNTNFTCSETENIRDYIKNKGVSDFVLPYGVKTEGDLLDFKVDKTVDINTLQTSKIISTVPQQGSSILMLYRSINTGPMPFEIKPMITRMSKNVLYYRITLESKYIKKVCATDVELQIPLPENTSSVEIIYHVGHCQPKLAFNTMQWIIGKASGDSKFKLEFECKLYNSIAAQQQQQERCLGDIKLHFVLPNLTISGLFVRSITLKNAVNKAAKYVQYKTINGEYHRKLMYPSDIK